MRLCAPSRRHLCFALAGLLLTSSALAQVIDNGASDPVLPTTAPKNQDPNEKPSSTNQQQRPAPIERRASKLGAGSLDPVAGPIQNQQTEKQDATAQSAEQPAKSDPNRSGPVETIRARSRLVNVAVNAVDAHGSPVGGLERSDFRLLEDGQEQRIAIFEREATSPLSIVLAIDTSGTVMTSERLEHEAAKRFVHAILRPQDELDLMDFSDAVREIVPFTNDLKRIDQGLGNLLQGDETALYDAVYLASGRLATTSQTAGRRRVLVVISDGGDSLEHGVKYEEAIAEAQRTDAMIYSIIVVPIAADAGRNTGGEHALIQMSDDTGGKYYYVTDPKDLEPAFQHVSDNLRTQYLLGYYAPERKGDTGFRRIKVVLAAGASSGAAHEGYQLRYRTGYFPEAPK